MSDVMAITRLSHLYTVNMVIHGYIVQMQSLHNRCQVNDESYQTNFA